jgi:hypothetical protein
MKKICKVILAAAAMVALAVPVMAVPVNKLIVKDSGGANTVFNVDDSGTVTGAKLGVGTTSPYGPIHLNLATGLTGLGAPAPVGTLLYNSAMGFIGSTQDNAAGAAFVVADNTATAGLRGNISGVRARGSLLVPTAPLVNDLVFSIIGTVYDGGALRNTADINFTVDGTVSSNIAPQRISFRTRTNGTGAYFERLTIKNDGKLLVDPTAMPVYADNATATTGGLAAGSLYRTSTGVLMMRY